MRIKGIVFVLLHIYAIAVFAQPPHVFTQYTAEDGLEQRMIRRIMQDSKGFLWLATWDGLYRFDGQTFRNYKSHKAGQFPLFIGNRINTIKEDAYGCIWLLDYNKRISRLNPLTEQITVVSNEDLLVSDFFVQANGHVWLVTENKGLLLAQTNAQDLSLHLRDVSKELNISASERINAVKLDREGNEWILTNTGIYHYTSNKGFLIKASSKHRFYDMLETESGLFFTSDNGRIRQYNKERRQLDTIQLPTASRISVLRLIDKETLLCGTQNDGFFVMSVANQQWKHYTKKRFGEMPDNRVRNAYVDKHGEVWIEQEHVGITHFEPRTDKITHFILPDKNGKPISNGHHYQLVVEDSRGNLYIHPNGGGFAWYDRESKQLVPFYNRQLLDGWGDLDVITDVCLDKQDNVWISSFANGLEKITLKNKQFSLYAPPQWQKGQVNSRAIFIDRDKRLWVGFQNMGVGVYDRNREFLGYLQSNGTLSSAESGMQVNAYSITQDHEGTIWIGTKGNGVIAAKAGSRSDTFALTHFSYNRSDVYTLSANDIWHIYEDKERRLWITTWDGGINYLEKDTQGSYRFINYRNKLKQYPIRSCAKARCITSDGEGRLWVATSDGLLVFDEKFGDPSQIRFNRITHIPGDMGSLNNNDITYVHLSARNELYVATFGGGLHKLISYKNEKAVFKSYTDKEGLLSNIVLSILDDADDNLWLSMMEGVSKFSPLNEHFENFSVKEFPLSIRFNDGNGCYSDADQKILFNTTQGVLCFNPAAVHKSTFTPSIVFTRLQLGNQVVLPNDSTGILELNLDATPQLVLTHRQNSFSISFAALDLNDPHNILYEYRLKGFESIWHKAGNTDYANYTNIPKGDYVLEVRSTNSDRVWVDNTRSLPIRILPSFWESPWGICLYTVLGILVAAAIFIYFRLRQKIRMEHQLSELRLQFFTNVSHELRTPLTLITGPVKNVLERDDLAPEIRNQLRVVDRNTNRMTNLINQILDFRKIQERKVQLSVQAITLVPFIRQLMECFNLLAEEHQIDFTLESNAPDIIVWADSDQLEKILFNLLSNAFKYTPNGKPVKIVLAEGEHEVRIEITDEGSGIPENKLKRLFERFESALVSQYMNQASTGLGLSLVKELMDMHKGSVSVQSRTGEGTSFVLHFRKGKAHFDAGTEFIRSNGNVPEIYDWKEELPLLTHEYEEEPHVERDTADSENFGKVLIVEDNQELRYFLKTALQGVFSQIIEAADGAEGLEKAKDCLPDLIISDIMMPGKDGIELLRSLREDITISHIPVILLTAKSAIESRIQGIELGAEDYVTKPFSIAYLKVSVANILERRKRLQTYYRSWPLPTLLEETSQEPTVSVAAMLEEEQQALADTITTNDQLFMKRLIDSIYKNLDNGNLKIEELTREVGVSRVIFYNKVKNLTGLSPVEFLKEVRLKQAAQLMQSDLNISQIAYQVGFNDVHYFSKCFRQQFGVTPTAYKNKESEEQSGREE